MLIEKYTPIFQDVDENRDGILDRDEYYAFEKGLYDMRVEAYGGFFEWTQDELDLWYDAQNTLTPDVDGISIDDIHRKLDIGSYIFTELASAGACDGDECVEGVLEGYVQCKEDEDCSGGGDDDADEEEDEERRRLEGSSGSGKVASGAKCLYVTIVGTVGGQEVDQIK